MNECSFLEDSKERKRDERLLIRYKVYFQIEKIFKTISPAQT
jgi:hypothetical protein